MTPEECRELADELPPTSGIGAALRVDANRQERGDTSPVVFEYVRDDGRMSAVDRTQHVLDAIDGALDDWSIGPDAMRWTPERERLAPRILTSTPRLCPPVTFSVAPAGTDPDVLSAWVPVPGVTAVRLQGFLEQASEALRPVVGAVERAAEAMGMSVREFADHLAGLRPLAEPRPEPEDPAARALRLRQQRHTGPDRDVTRQRRPRRHIPR